VIFETNNVTDDFGLNLAKSSHNQIVWSVGRDLKFCQTTKFKILLADHICKTLALLLIQSSRVDTNMRKQIQLKTRAV
jgi:hypothetical protein